LQYFLAVILVGGFFLLQEAFATAKVIWRQMTLHSLTYSYMNGEQAALASLKYFSTYWGKQRNLLEPFSHGILCFS